MSFENPEFVERMLKMRREKLGAGKLPPPGRTGMAGELNHPTLPGVTTGWFEITETRALVWLDYNVHNRALNKRKIAGFARQHANGDFVATHQGIAFNDANELIDGQHTLKMVLLTGKPVMRMVTFGLPKKPEGKQFNTMDVIDSGGRNVSDQLKISHNISDPGLKKQICAALASLCVGKRARNLSMAEILKVLEAFKSSIEFVVANRSRQMGLKQAGVLSGFAFAHAAFTGGKNVEPAFIEQLFKALNTGAGLDDAATYQKNHAAGREARPIEHLRGFLTAENAALLKWDKKMNRCIAEVTLQALYAECQRARTKELENSDIGAKWFAAKQKERVAKIAALFREVKRA